MTTENSEKSIRRESRLAVFEHVVKKEKDSKSSKFVANRLDSDDSSPSDSELIIDDEREELENKKKLLVRLTEEPLNLKCCWSCCHELFTSWQTFNIHLKDHAHHEAYTLRCYWNKCMIICQSVALLTQHVCYHGYLAKLRNIGLNVLERNDLPSCTQSKIYVMPVSLDGYTCEWENCSVRVDTVYDYFAHVEQHVRGNPRIAKGDDVIVCHWNGCNLNFSTRYKLGEHIRTHTKERTIGCPTCCTLFSNKTKFCDHRRRQLSTDLQSYQCSQCLKLFPTERLLRDHMRSHINHYKCTMCDMTCPKPSILAKHIRFKHVKDKPFKCEHCDKTFVTKHNLQTHLEIHKEEAMLCELCDFKCRTKVGLQNHYVKKHDQHSEIYECHCCKKHFKRGGHLTKHLMKVHNYHWPSGHTRFRYRKDQDGIYRLQTVRYESLEVTEEMIKSETMQSKNRFSLKYDNETPASYVLSIADEELHSEIVEEQHNDVLITINDVDVHGNIIKSQVMKSKEIIGTISDDNFLSEHQYPMKSEIVIEEEVKREQQVDEFVECSEVRGTLNVTDPVESTNVKRKSHKKKPLVKKYKKTENDLIETDEEENKKKLQKNAREHLIPKSDTNYKRKRKRNNSEKKPEKDETDAEGQNIRRSQRLQSFRESGKSIGEV